MLRFIWQQNNFLSRVFGLKMDYLVLKVKPKKIWKRNKLQHLNIFANKQYCAITLSNSHNLCIIQDIWHIICQKIVHNLLENKTHNSGLFEKQN